MYGTPSTPSYHLLSRLNKTLLSTGEALLATMLVCPTSNIFELRHRQNITKKFLKNQKETEEIISLIKNFKKSENSLLSFWTKREPLYSEDYIRYMNSKFYSKTNDKFNKSAGRLDSYKRFFRDFVSIQLNFIWPTFLYATPEIIFLMSGPSTFYRTVFYQCMTPVWGMIYPFTLMNNDWARLRGEPLSSGNMWGNFTLGTTITALYTWSVYSGIKSYQEYSEVLRRLALRMSDIQNFIKTIEKIDGVISKTPELEAVYGKKLIKIRQLLNTDKKTELGRLVNYMKKLPLTSWSYFFNNSGKLLASYKLFLEHKDKLNDALFELGQIDLYSSISKLVSDSKNYNQDSCFNFVEYLNRNQQNKPFLSIKDMWNPLLDSKNAVTNSLTMDSSKGTRNILLTGPNAGGKSTYLTGITTTVLLAQSFGIAPAKKVTITPFDKINTYMNISDDVATGKSLFMAEVDRAKKHINTLENLKPNEFSFTIMDELFSGTNPYEGEAAAYSIMKYLSKTDNALNIIATHFPIVMSLEDKVPQGRFKNYKVYIIRNKEKGKLFTYTYKVIPGKSNQAIAIDILEQQNFNREMLRDARDVLKNRKNYISKFRNNSTLSK